MKLLPHRHLPLTIFGLAIYLSWATAADSDAALTKEQETLVRHAVWGLPPVRKQALDELAKLPITPERVRQVEALIRAGRPYEAIKEAKQSISVAIDGDRQLQVNVLLPPGYDPAKRYPLMVAMGGGPIANEKQAKGQANGMLNVWSKPAQEAGWITAAIEDTISVRKLGKALRYPMLRDEYFRAVLDGLVERYAIDPNRIHATGISLGSNYSLVYAAAHPDWFAGIAPVSTEGESREHVLRNVQHVSIYVLEGAKDKNIRSIDGPRAMAKILDGFGYRHRYEEEPDKGHEGFVVKYPAVLKWLAERQRQPFPREVLRVPNPGIVMPAKRFYWVEADTHQAAFQASVEGNVITVNAARARKLTFHLSDRLLKVDKPVVIRVNGKTVHDKKLDCSLKVALEDAAHLNDSERFATARVTVELPDLQAGEKWLTTLEPKTKPGLLAYWEDFAVQTWKEERPGVPADMEQLNEGAKLPSGFAALRVKSTPENSSLRSGDLVLEVDNEPFFAATDGVAFIRDYLWRTSGKSLRLKIERAGERMDLAMPLP
jgi:pimeloyl-ACP methyl ester carboxylesterase